MAKGTAGLGQGNQVFDFSNIGQAGLAYDAREYAKKEAFVKQNASLYDPIDASGIRDVDSPYINQELENAMELAATAQKTMNPEDAQRAKNAMSAVSQLAATSKAALTQETEAYTKLRETPEFIRNSTLYTDHLNQHRQSTAMNNANQGKVGQSILYQAPVMYNTEKSVAEFAAVDAEKILRGALETEGKSTTNADGTSSGWSLSDVDEKIKADLIAKTFGSQMDSNKEFKLSIEAQYMADKFFDKTDLTDEDVRNFENARAYGDELRNAGYKSLEDLRKSGEFANNPRKLRQAEKAFDIENGIESYGLEMYTNAVDPRATKGQQFKSSEDNSVKGGSGDDGIDIGSLALSEGLDVKSALGAVKIKGEVPMTENQQIGYASAPKMKAYASGSGTERIVTGGVIAQKVGNKITYFAVEYKPSPDLFTKIKQGDGDAVGLLQKTDATLVEIKGGYSRVPSGDLKVMKSAALERANLVDITAAGNTENESTEEGSESTKDGGSMSGF